MTPKPYPLLERALTDGREEAERLIRQIVEEAVEAQMNEVCEWFESGN